MLRRYLLIFTLLAGLLASCHQQPTPPPSVAIGTTSNPVMQLMAHIYAAGLATLGTPTHIQVIPDPVSQLDNATIDLTPGLTGTLLARFDPHTTLTSQRQVYRSLMGMLPEGTAVTDYAQAANEKPVILVTSTTAKKQKLTHIDDLTDRCLDIHIGIIDTATIPQNLGKCHLAAIHHFVSTQALFNGLTHGTINAAWIIPTTPIPPGHFTALADSSPPLIRAENIVGLYRTNTLTERQILVLNQIAGIIDTPTLIALCAHIANGASIQHLAQDWLDAHPLEHS